MPPKKKTTRVARPQKRLDLNQQGANALLAATFEFLRRNNISGESIVTFAKKYAAKSQRGQRIGIYKEIEKTHEHMGVIMGTWFSDPRFLDSSGYPIPLSCGPGKNSISRLIRASRTRVLVPVAIELMRQSPSIRITRDGDLLALRRVFVLPKLDVTRAAFVVERYLSTLRQIVSGRKKETALLLERSCHVSEVDLATIAPMLRDIESRGTAFMDSIDGDLEGRRLRSSKRKNIGEVGVVVFAWTRPKNAKKVRGNKSS